MEQQTQSTASSDTVLPAHGLNRCRARNRTGAQCRLRAQDPVKGLCSRHVDRAARTTHSAPDRADLSTDLFGEIIPSFKSAEEINATLANLVVLVAQGRISSRRAAVITYALSLILRGVLVIDKKAADTPSQLKWSDTSWRPACAIRAEAARNSFNGSDSAHTSNSGSNHGSNATPPMS
ncbi:MAG: hypothetical protein WA765_00280 [Candidatus Acidiferrum sp.]